MARGKAVSIAGISGRRVITKPMQKTQSIGPVSDCVEMYQNGPGSARSGFDFALMGQVALTDPRLKIQHGSDGYVYLSWDWNYWCTGAYRICEQSGRAMVAW